MNIQEILDEALGKNIVYLDDKQLYSDYNYGKVDETISMIDKKLEGIRQELKSLNILLENYNAK